MAHVLDIELEHDMRCSSSIRGIRSCLIAHTCWCHPQTGCCVSCWWFGSSLQDYLERFKELILTASGLDMQPARSAQPLPLGPERRQLLLTAA